MTIHSHLGRYQEGMQDLPYTELADQHRAPPARGMLGKSTVFAIFIVWTLFAVYVYSRYSQLGDARSYLTGAYDDAAQARTYLITQIATTVISLVRVDVLAHLVFSLFTASGVAYLVGQARVHGPYRWPLLAILLLPSFGVWASVVGREALYIGLLAYFMGATIGYLRQRGMRRWWLALLCVAGMTFIRAPFGAAMGVFFLMVWMLSRGPRTGLSLGVQAVLLTIVGAIALVFAWPHIDAYIAGEVLPKARSFFTIGSATTRLWVDIATTDELLSSLWWTLPLSLVGPTPGEVLARPVMLPFLLSGLLVFFLLLYAIQQAIRAPAGLPRKVLLLGWLPALLMTLVAYVPFGIYNPGSGIRYASCFLLFIVYPWMLRSALATLADAPVSLRRGAVRPYDYRLAELR